MSRYPLLGEPQPGDSSTVDRSGVTPPWCLRVFREGGQVAVLAHDAREGGRGAVLGYATHETAFEKRSNIQFLLSMQLSGKPADAHFASQEGGRVAWYIAGVVKFAADLSEVEKAAMLEELCGEELALGISERKQDRLIKVKVSKTEDVIRLEMNGDAKQQILSHFETRAQTRAQKFTMYLCRDCASLRYFWNRQRVRSQGDKTGAGAAASAASHDSNGSKGSNGSNGSGGCSGVDEQALLHVRPVKYAEPYALVRKDVMSKLKEATP